MMGLRHLTPSQQVGLLFLLLFGVLVLVTAAALIGSLRERSEAERAAHETFKRELRAVWIGASVFWLAWASGPIGATLLFGAVSFLALREYITLMHTRRSDHRSLILAFFIVLPLQYLLVANRNFDLFSVFVPVYVFLAIPVASALAGDPERFLERNAKIQWGITVCVYGLSHTPALLLLQFANAPDRGAFLVFFLVIVVAVAQSTMGEFVMQALKRDAGVRRWGLRSSVTGAVGLLDRVAALCFAAPVFFHSVRWYFSASV